MRFRPRATGVSALDEKEHALHCISIRLVIIISMVVFVFSLLIYSVRAPSTSKPLYHLRGNGVIVYSVAFSPDSKILATGNDDNRVQLWDMKTGTVIRTFEGHSSAIYGVQLSSDCQIIVSASLDCTTRVWDVETGSLLAEIKHDNNQFWVALSPDNSRIATTDHKGSVRLWDWRRDTQHEVTSLKMSGSYARAPTFSPDGRLLAVCSSSNFVRVFDLSKDFRAQDYVVPLSVDEVSSVTFSSDQKYIAAGSGVMNESGEVTVWELGKATPVVRIHQALPVLAVSFSSCDLSLAWGGVDGDIYLRRDIYKNEDVIFKGHNDSITSIALSADCRLLAAGSFDRSVIVWDLRTPRIELGR